MSRCFRRTWIQYSHKILQIWAVKRKNQAYNYYTSKIKWFMQRLFCFQSHFSNMIWNLNCWQIAMHHMHLSNIVLIHNHRWLSMFNSATSGLIATRNGYVLGGFWISTWDFECFELFSFFISIETSFNHYKYTIRI